MLHPRVRSSPVHHGRQPGFQGVGTSPRRSRDSKIPSRGRRGEREVRGHPDQEVTRPPPASIILQDGGVGTGVSAPTHSSRRDGCCFLLGRDITIAPSLNRGEKSSQPRSHEGKVSFLAGRGQRAVPGAGEEESLRNGELGAPGAPGARPSGGRRPDRTAAGGRRRGLSGFCLPGGLPGLPAAAGPGPRPLARAEGRERGAPLTFSSSDTRSSKSAILGCSGPARRGAGHAGKAAG